MQNKIHTHTNNGKMKTKECPYCKYNTVDCIELIEKSQLEGNQGFCGKCDYSWLIDAIEQEQKDLLNLMFHLKTLKISKQ